MNLADRVHRMAEPFKALPVRRVYIPKRGSSTKRRPLGIPVLSRCHQARVVNALEPEREAWFEPRFYGFRPGRGCHDAIDAIHRTSCGQSTKRQWVLGAVLAGAFDQIAHDHILTMLGTFPARGDGRPTAEGECSRARSASPHRRGDPPEWCRQPSAAEHCSARDGEGCQGPLPHHRQGRRVGDRGLAGVD